MRARFSPVRWLGVVLLIIVTPHWGACASEQDRPAAAAGERAATAVPLGEEGHVPLHPGDAAKIEDARQLLIQHRYDDALALLNGITPDTVSAEIEIEFLKARIAEVRGDPEASVVYYRGILGNHPRLTRVRLELARVLFRLEDDDAARHHFELVLGEDLPEAVRSNVEQFLAAIHRRRRLKVRFGASLVPDTNINSATDSRRVDIFGVPFNLSDDARSSTGVGVSLNGGLDYSYPLAEALTLETGTALTYLDYPSDSFDDVRLSGYLGGRWSFASFDAGLAATGSRRWYADDGYSLSVGARGDLGKDFTQRWSGRIHIGGQSIDYDEQDFLDGEVYSLQLESGYLVDSVSRLSLFGGLSYEDTAEPAYSNMSPFFGVSYRRDFPYRISATLQPMIFMRFFEDDQPLFGETREDVTLRFRTKITYRTDLLFGFAPTMTYTFTHNDSNIGFYDYNRHRVEFGLSREF